MDSLLKQESWIVNKWRPMMAWLYMAICAFDFIIAPTLFLMHQIDAAQMTAWVPITMAQGGLFHLSMGAIIGVSAWSRGQEKITYIETLKKIKSEYEGVDVVKKDEAV